MPAMKYFWKQMKRTTSGRLDTVEAAIRSFHLIWYKSGHPVTGQTRTCYTDNHGKDTCYQAVEGHSSEIVGSEEFAEGLQADWIRYPLGLR